MKISYGILMASACALALGGCTASEGWNSIALLGSGVVNTTNGNVTSTSAAATDVQTKADVSYDDQGTVSVADDTVSVKVKDGDAVSGPRDYVLDTSKGTSGVLTSSSSYGYAYFKPATTPTTDQSILIAGVGAESWSGFVGANATAGGAGNIAAAYGGNNATGTMPTGAVTYTGSAAASVATVGSSADNILGGSSSIAANFTSGAVTGTMNFTGTANDVGFIGTMSSSKAGYTAASVTLGGTAATGQAQGGFFGDGYTETAGIFDVTQGTTKVVGAFGGALP